MTTSRLKIFLSFRSSVPSGLSYAEPGHCHKVDLCQYESGPYTSLFITSKRQKQKKKPLPITNEVAGGILEY